MEEVETTPLEKIVAKYNEQSNSTDPRTAERAREMLVILAALGADHGERFALIENAVSVISARVTAIEDAARVVEPKAE